MKKILTLITLLIFCCLMLQNADAQTFGKNKKQYKMFDWKYIESTHFDIYYDKGSKELADFAAVALEEALVSIQNTLNYTLTSRIPIIVYASHNEFQQTNVINSYLSQGIGGVTELYKNRVVIPFQGSYEQYRHVLHHELVHAVLNDMFYGGTFQTAISTRGVAELPVWMNEGFAEWESIGGMDAATDMFMRDLTLNDELPNLKNLGGYLAYRAGQTFFWFIENKYGKGKVTELMNKLKLFKSLDIAMRNTFGMDLDEFSEYWQTEIKKVYLPEIVKYKAPKEFAKQITNHTKDNCYYYSSPAISPSGDKLAFISDRDGGVFSLFVSNTSPVKDNDYDMKRLISSARALDFEQLNILTPSISWSPDGKRIAISAKSGGEDAIYLVDAESGKYEKILLGFGSITSVKWSPDGGKIAFIGVKDCKSDVFYYDLKKEKLYQLTNDFFSDTYPEWSSDSKKIYYISDRGDREDNGKRVWLHNYEQSDIFCVDLKNKNIERITRTPNIKKSCVVAASDGKQLLIVANVNGIDNIYNYSLIAKEDHNNNLIPLTNSANSITQISVSNNGLNMVFCSQVKSGYDIFLLRNPFEMSQVDSLPLTQYAMRLQGTSTKTDTNIITTNEENVDFQYGNYSIDFSQQQFLNANDNALTHNTKQVTQDTTAQLGDLVEKEYEVHFSLDAFVLNPAVSTYYGFQGSTAVLFSDIMGNNQIYLAASLLSSLENSQFYGAYLYNTKMIDWQFSFFNSSMYTWNYVDSIDYDNLIDYTGYYPYAYRATGAIIGASYPFDLFHRFELNFNFVNAAKHNAELANFENISKFLFVPEVKYTIDNSLNGIYAPTRGMRAYIKALYSPNLGKATSEFATIMTDVRQYIEIMPNFMCIALRGSAGASFGTNAQKFYIGGVDNWINSMYRTGNFQLENPEDFAFMNSFAMPLRGWAWFQHNGTKFAMANLEYRFPILMAFNAGGLPLFIQGIQGNVFYDVGATWNNSLKISYTAEDGTRYPGDLYMSAGWGIRAILLGLPFRFDMAWRNEYSGWSSPYYLFSLGLDW